MQVTHKNKTSFYFLVFVFVFLCFDFHHRKKYKMKHKINPKYKKKWMKKWWRMKKMHCKTRMCILWWFRNSVQFAWIVRCWVLSKETGRKKINAKQNSCQKKYYCFVDSFSFFVFVRLLSDFFASFLCCVKKMRNFD